WPELAGQAIWSLLEDREGAIWTGSIGIPTGRLCSIQKGKADCAGEDGAIGRSASGLYEDKNGNVWVVVVNGIVRWKPGPRTFYSLDSPYGEGNFCEDSDGGLLIGTSKGIQRLVNGKVEDYSIAGAHQQLGARRLLRDRDGGLWIATHGQ